MLKNRYFILLFILLLPLLSFGQEAQVDIKGRIDDLNTGSGLGGVTVGLYKNGTLVESVTTASNGKYKFKKTAAEGLFTVRFSKAGYVGKYAEIDTRGIHPEDANDLPLEVNTSLFEEVPNVDFSILNNKPAAKAKYNKDIDNIEWNVDYIEKTKKEVDKIIAKAEEEKRKQEEQAAAGDKKFNDAVTAGNAAAQKGDYTTAIAKYDEALSVKDDADVKAKKEDAIKKKELADSNAAADKKYNDAMAEAKKLFDAKDYGSAKAKYQEAALVKDKEQAPKDKIKEIEQILAKQIDKENNYQKLLADGEKAMLAEKYDEAIKNFTDAKNLRPNEQQPKDELKKAQDAKAAAEKDALAEKKKKEDFEKFVAAGDNSVTGKKYDDAIANYDKALALIDDPDVKTKKENAIKAKDADALAKEEAEKLKKKQEEFEALMNKGKTELTQSQYDPAIATFETALTVIPNEPTAVAKLAEAKKLKAEAEKADELAKENQKKFDDLIARGDSETGNAEYDKAIATYKEALTIFKDDANAKSKLAEAEKKKAEYAKNKAEFDKLVADADGAVGTKKYDDAITKYEKALTLFNESAVQTKLDNAKSERDKLNSSTTKFNELVKLGDTQAGNKEYESAIKSFEEALAVIPNDAGATAKLADAKKKLKEIEDANKLAEAQKEEEFKKHYNAGMTHSTQSEFKKAIEDFEAALTVKPNDPEATKALADAKTRLEEFEKLKDEAYKQKIDLADKFFNEGKFQDAKTYYEKANKQRPEEDYPKTRITECETKIKEAELADAEAKKNRDGYEAAKAKADQLFNASKWKESITQYEEALKFIDEEYPKTKIKEAQDKIDAELNALNSEKEKKERFSNLLKEGDANVKDQNYDEAIANFEEALTIIEKEPNALAKLADAKKKKEEKEKEDLLAAQKDANKQKFDLLVAQGDDQMNNEEYEKAIKSYTDALTFVPNDLTTKKKIEEATKKKAAADLAAQNDAAKQRELDEKFKKHYNDGMTHSTQSEFKKAIQDFEDALAIKPNDPDATKALADAKTRLEEYEKLKDEAYKQKIDLADKFFNEKKYEDAKTYYEKANKQRPDEQYPKERIEEINKIIADQAKNDEEAKKLRAAYDQAMASGNKELGAKNFDKAIAYYENAKIVLPSETEPDIKIEEARRLKQEELDKNKLANSKQKFEKLMNEGQSFMNSTEFDNAINRFESALDVIPNEPSAVKALALAKQRKKEKEEEIANEFAKMLAFADKEFGAENWKDAKKYYEKYERKFKNGDPYCLSQIEICNQKIIEAEGLMSDSHRYDELIKEGNKLFDASSFSDARSKYVDALKIFADMEYPKKRIAEIDGMGKNNNTTTNTNTNSNTQIANQGGIAPRTNKVNYGDKTNMTADEALSLLLAAKLGDERDKYAKIQREKNKIDDANKEASIQSEKSRTENNNEFSDYKEKLIDFNNNTEFVDNNTTDYRNRKDEFEKNTLLWNSENDIKKNNKAAIQQQHDIFDMNRFEEKLRFINSDIINSDKDKMIAYNQEVDLMATNTRNNNGEYLQNQKDKFVTDTRGVENTIQAENADEVRNAFMKQHDENAKNNALADETRNKNAELLINEQDEFSNYSKSIQNNLKDATAYEFRSKHEEINNTNKSIDILSTYTRETNGTKLQTQKDSWANDLNDVQDVLLAQSSSTFRTAHDDINTQNQNINQLSSETRTKNGDQLLQMKDDFANNNKNVQNVLLDQNGQIIRSEFDELNSLHQKMDETSANTRNNNAQELDEKREGLKEISDKGALSPAENVRRLKELQDQKAAEQKKMDAQSNEKHWNTKEELAKRGENSNYSKGKTGYKSQYTVDYPQGVTEEVYTRRDGNDNIAEVTIRRIVVEGDYGNEYRKTVSKSGTFYFKNGVTITAQTWDTEANK